MGTGSGLGYREGESDDRKRNPRSTLGTHNGESSSSSSNRGYEFVQNVLRAPFGRRNTDPNRILSDLAPVIMTPRLIHTATNISSRPRASVGGVSLSNARLDFMALAKIPLRLGVGGRRITSRELQIAEVTEELLEVRVPNPEGIASNISLLRGFNATIPSAEQGRSRRRLTRSVETPRLGLKRLGMSARGMLADEPGRQSVGGEDDVVVVPKLSKRRERESLSTLKSLGKEELMRQANEIKRDKENLHVRRSLINSEIAEITRKIEALDYIRAKFEADLLNLQEVELELDDELEGVKERIEFEKSNMPPQSVKGHRVSIIPPSRRRKGPAFLPSEHNDLPPGVAFMTLDGHSSQIACLDLSEPYGVLVSASQDESQPRVWDLFSGAQIGSLRGHAGTVKCVQVEGSICLTGGEDGNVRIWDLRRVDGDNGWDDGTGLSDVKEDDEEIDDEEKLDESSSAIGSSLERLSACSRVLEGHTKAVTALYFEDDCLVTGASDKTLRQWDLTTGQCVMTMDILWAISHPPSTCLPSGISGNLFPGTANATGSFAVPTPRYADGSWDMYEDFVGGLQFWGYGLVSGSGDGAVRMWDMRTGQAHRTLMGHTGPVTCLQFDEIHIASGSLDKTLRIWDLRSGGIFETIKYDHAITSLQFDTRKIIAATGENGVEIYNRTSMQHTSLVTNGHTKPVEKVRYMDRYMVTGGRDSMLKIWSL